MSTDDEEIEAALAEALAVRDKEILAALEAVLETRDANELEDLIAEADGWHVRWAPVLAKLLVQRWHSRHEDLARALQDLREPSTIDALLAVALDASPYDQIDDGRALARKCVWALHDIGAIAALQQIAGSANDAETRGRAAKKLAELATRSPDAPPQPYRIARDRNVRR